jgi:hypothetical protein
LLGDGAEDVAGARDMRQIDLGLDLFFAVDGGACSFGRARSGVTTRTEMLPNQFRFMLFQRTGVRFLFRNSHRGQGVKNFLALDLQLTGQIIDSNLHPLSFSFASRPV